MRTAPAVQAADLFCGAGGFTEGFLRACEQLGIVQETLAINHWDVAVATHELNHPGVRHLCQSLETVNPREVVPGGRLDYLLCAPECTHFSGARGGKPMSDQSRACPWRVLEWADALDVRLILMENVKEFPTWGPLHPCTCGTKDPKKHLAGARCFRPIEGKRGLYFRKFVSNLRAYGYRVEWQVLCAADYGDATTRERFFLQARKGRQPIAWPEPTHRPPAHHRKAKTQSTLPGMGSEVRHWRPAREIIRWDVKGESIFTREARGKKPLCENTLKRIFEGLRRFCGLEFILPHQHGNSGDGNVRSVEEPLSTITGTSADMFLAQPYLIGAGGPERSGRPAPVHEPLGTVLTANHRALIQPYVVLLRNNATGSSIDDPLRTITAGGGHHGLAEAFLIPNFTERDGQRPRGHSVDDPLPAVTSHGAGALVRPFLAAIDQQSGGAQVRDTEQPLAAITTKARLALVQPYLLQLSHTTSDRAGRHISIDEPVPTITGTREYAVVEPYLLGQQSQAAPRPVSEPVPTIAGAGAISLIESYLVAYRGNHAGEEDAAGRVHSVNEPLRTIDTSNRYALAHPYLVKYYGTGGAVSVDRPLDTITAQDRFALVTPELEIVGEVLGRLEILFRMLMVEELAGAMGFNAGRRTYVFTGNQEAQVRQVGNAVPCELARALSYAAITGQSLVPPPLA